MPGIFDIEHFLDFNKTRNVQYQWVEPVYIGPYVAYCNENNISSQHNTGYVNTMIGMNYSEAKSYSPVEHFNSRVHIDHIANHLSGVILKNIDYLNEEDRNDLNDYLRYLFTEIMNNVIDHSRSPIGGIAMAQHYPNKKEVQFVVADRGVGFLENIKIKRPDAITEKEAIEIAIQKGFTATPATMYGHERNAGFGLYAMSEILKQTGGTYIIISNDTIMRYRKGRIEFKKLVTPYKGVVVAFNFAADEINYTLNQFQRGYLWNETDDEDLLY